MDTSISTVIPLTKKPPEEWKYEDFMGLEPYEWIYSQTDKFMRQQTKTAMKNIAKSLKFSEFNDYWKAYLESKSPKVTILGDYDTAYTKQPVQLKSGKYMCDDYGVNYVNEMGQDVTVISHPILPVKRVTNIETYEEKLEIAYRRGKDPWKTITVTREQLASAQKIIGLARQGIHVNSENAKEVVKFLGIIESINYDNLPKQNSVSHMGWLEDGQFMPYVKDVNYDGESTELQNIYNQIAPHGSEEVWLNLAKEVRSGSSVPARIALAAAFAAPLVQPLGCLNFFVHFWGDTGCGKSVASMLAASVYANPEIGRYIKTFSGTKVSMELYAAFCCNLPVQFDELQVIADRKQYDDLIYMLTEGASKGRGAKEGGLQIQKRWLTCIITNGEMPIIQGNSGGGAVARTIDVNYGGIPLFENARDVANTLKENYGHIGPKYIKALQKEGTMDAVKALYKKVYGELIKCDIQDKQVMSAALLIVADIIATKAIFKDDRALTIDDIKPYLASRSETDVNLRCYQWLIEFCAANPRRFDSVDSANGEVWGKYEDGYVYINKSIFDEQLKQKGFSSGAFLDWAKRKEILKHKYYGPGNKNNKLTLQVRVNGKPVQHVVLKLPEEEDKTEQDAYRDYVAVNVPDLPF